MILVTAGRNIDNGNIALVVAEDKGKAFTKASYIWVKVFFKILFEKQC